MRPPHPVLLVPGWSDSARAMRRIARFLVDSGWPRDHVHALDFGDRYGSNVIHAREVARAADSMRAATGASRIDIVAHSMGGLATRRFLADHSGPDGPPVRRVIFLATPHAGTWAALLAFGGGRREMLPGSPFLRDLHARPWPVGVEAISVRTRLDLRVFPNTSAVLECAHNHCIRAVTHQGLLRSPRVLAFVRDTLLDLDVAVRAA